MDTSAGYYKRKLLTKAKEITLKGSKLRHLLFDTVIIERYKRRESSVEEALIEMYLVGVSVHRLEDITEALWGAKATFGAISELNKKYTGILKFGVKGNLKVHTPMYTLMGFT